MKKIMSLALVALLGQSIAQAVCYQEKIVITVPAYLNSGIAKVIKRNEHASSIVNRSQAKWFLGLVGGCAAAGALNGYCNEEIFAKDRVAYCCLTALMGGVFGMLPGAFAASVVYDTKRSDLAPRTQRAIDKLLAACKDEKDRELVRNVLRENGIYIYKNEIYI